MSFFDVVEEEMDDKQVVAQSYREMMSKIESELSESDRARFDPSELDALEEAARAPIPADAWTGEEMIERLLACEKGTFSWRTKLKLYFDMQYVGWEWLKPRLMYFGAFFLIFTLPLQIERTWAKYVGGPDAMLIMADEAKDIPTDGSFDNFRVLSDADIVAREKERQVQLQREMQWIALVNEAKQRQKEGI